MRKQWVIGRGCSIGAAFEITRDATGRRWIFAIIWYPKDANRFQYRYPSFPLDGPTPTYQGEAWQL